MAEKDVYSGSSDNFIICLNYRKNILILCMLSFLSPLVKT